MVATHFYEALGLNTFNGITAVGIPNIFVALYATDPGDTGQGGIELQYPEYSRQPLVLTPPFAEGGGIAVRNVGDILWSESTADVGQARFIGILDSGVVGSGNMLLRGELTIPLDIRAGRQPSIAQGDIMFIHSGATTVEFKTRFLNICRGLNMLGISPHMALFDGDPEAGGSELSGPTYSRPNIIFNTPSIQPAGFTEIANTNEVQFPRPTTTWGNKAWAAIMDSQVGGQAIVKVQFAVPEIIAPNHVPIHNPGNIRISLN